MSNIFIQNSSLVVDQGDIQRRYHLGSNGLQIKSLSFRGEEWLSPNSEVSLGRQEWMLSKGSIKALTEERLSPVGVMGDKGSYIAQHQGQAVEFHFFCHRQLPVITQWITGPKAEVQSQKTTGEAKASGIECDDQKKKSSQNDRFDRLESLNFCRPHLELHHIDLMEQTDVHDNLIHHRCYNLFPSQTIQLQGCVYWIEDPLTKTGWVLIKWAPQSYARPESQGRDLNVQYRLVELLDLGGESSQTSYPWTMAHFSGGLKGASRMIQSLQREWRLRNPQLDGLLLSNTWGDRNRDAALNENFMLKEIESAQNMGVEVVQIDDGWELGVSSNSSLSSKENGVWEGFYHSNEKFWSIHPDRFPQGLHFFKGKVNCGLWFAPDSADSFKNWRKDAETIMQLYRDLQVQWIKIDAVKALTKTGEENLAKFFKSVLEESDGKVVFDFDVTAEIRPGFLGLPHIGHIFLENRYTDWVKYWPHTTLKNIWELSIIIPPSRLRMEFLNPDRNIEKYGDDPLAPVHYSMDYMFAAIMLSAPLAWFELQSLSQQRIDELLPILKLWKTYRDELHSGFVTPIGSRPNGCQWTGFHIISQDGNTEHLLVFRERFAKDSQYFESETLTAQGFENIYGEGSIYAAEEGLRINQVPAASVSWWRKSKS